jgi:menaquinone-dependent protoporphyrinogen oxidase
MNFLLVYGTVEGQTQKIVRFLADCLTLKAHRAVTTNVTDTTPPVDPREFDAILIAAPVHFGRYPSAVADYVRKNLRAVSAAPNAFLSVSLSAAGADPDDHAGLTRCVAGFVRETEWQPDDIHHVAGAFRFRSYGFFKRWAMRYIALRKGVSTDTRRNYELTDWNDLVRFADAFVRVVSSRRAADRGSDLRATVH